MINPLKVATGGYLKRTSKAVLIIAVSGYLNYSDSPVPSGFGGGRIDKKHEVFDDKKSEEKELRERRIIDDSEIIAIVEMCLKITTI